MKLVTRDLAQQALARDTANRWQLLQNPARIRVQTIDSLCASITRQMPWLSRFGAFPEITEKAAELYREAARNTLRMVKEEEREDREGPLSVLLLHLDNNFDQAERLIAQMLEKRDQWLRRTGYRAGSGGRPRRPRTDPGAPDRTGTGGAASRDSSRRHSRYSGAPESRHAAGVQSARQVANWLQVVDLVLTTGNTYRIKAPKDMPRRTLDPADGALAGRA